MTPEIFKPRLLQIELERDALLLHERIMDKYNALDPNHERYAVHHYEQVKDDLRSLGRGIDNLINEYQAAGGKPAPSPSEWESKARRVMAGALLFIERYVDHDLGLNTGGTVYSKATIREDVIALLGLKEDDDKLMLDCNGEGTGK